ncbi:type II secretion protein F [Ruegeria atlantica]|uniref:type II secretion protein F n=1 Tax=Ruegeria atlantica TaxID=81569 RepID=UPI00147B5589|nr:type II secretion protein F [Ruegeria atlantica]
MSAALIFYRRMFFGARTRARTWRLLADLAEAKLSLGEALGIVADSWADQGKAPVAAIVREMAEGNVTGHLADRARVYVPDSEMLLLDRISSLDEVQIFRAAMRVAEQRDKLTRAIQGAVIPPVVLLMMLGVVVYMLGTQLYPNLALVRPIGQWPGPAQIVGGFSFWFVDNVALILVAGALIVPGFRLVLARWTAYPRARFDRVVPFSLYKLQAGVGFIFTITELGRMGKKLDSDLLEDMAHHSGPYLRSRIAAIARNVAHADDEEAWKTAFQKTGHEFPARDLNAVFAALVSQQDSDHMPSEHAGASDKTRPLSGLDKFAGFLDRWMEDFEAMVKSRTVALNMILLTLVAAAIGSTMLSTLSIVQTIY